MSIVQSQFFPTFENKVWWEVRKTKSTGSLSRGNCVTSTAWTFVLVLLTPVAQNRRYCRDAAAEMKRFGRRRWVTLARLVVVSFYLCAYADADADTETNSARFPAPTGAPADCPDNCTCDEIRLYCIADDTITSFPLVTDAAKAQFVVQM